MGSSGAEAGASSALDKVTGSLAQRGTCGPEALCTAKLHREESVYTLLPSRVC